MIARSTARPSVPAAGLPLGPLLNMRATRAVLPIVATRRLRLVTLTTTTMAALAVMLVTFVVAGSWLARAQESDARSPC